jgi:hypothetical protein
MNEKYPICIPGAPVSVPQMTEAEVREGLVAAGTVIMKGCECGGRFERVDDIAVDTVVDGVRVVVRHLHGLRCSRCGMGALSPESMHTVERRMREKRSGVRYKRPVRVPKQGIPV